MKSNSLTPIVDGLVWIHERHLWFSGVKLRARCTVIRLEDGSLLLHSPAPLTPQLADELRALGPVRWLMVPNRFHHLATPAAAKFYPDAKVVGPSSVLEKNKSLKLDVDIHSGDFGARVPELELLPLRGVPFLDETVVFHKPSHTLIGADIAMSARANDHWTWRIAGRVTGCYDKLRLPPDVRRKIVDKGAAARSIDAIKTTPAHRLLVAHTDVVDAGWADALAEAWRLVGVA